MSVMQHLFSTLLSPNKQFLLSCHLPRSVFFPPGPFYLLPSPVICVPSASPLPLSPPSPASCPAPNYVRYAERRSLQVRPLPLNGHTWYFSPPLASVSFLLRGAQPLHWMRSCESLQALCGILNPEPRPKLLPRQNLFICDSPPSPVLLSSPRPSQPFHCVDNSCPTVAKWQLQRVIATRTT